MAREFCTSPSDLDAPSSHLTPRVVPMMSPTHPLCCTSRPRTVFITGPLRGRLGLQPLFASLSHHPRWIAQPQLRGFVFLVLEAGARLAVGPGPFALQEGGYLHSRDLSPRSQPPLAGVGPAPPHLCRSYQSHGGLFCVFTVVGLLLCRLQVVLIGGGSVVQL